MPKYLLFCGLFLVSSVVIAQQNRQVFTLHINPLLNGNSIQDGILSGQINGDSIAIHTLRFYLGNFVFLKNGKEVGRDTSGYHLLDMEDAKTMSISLPIAADFDAVRFTLGTDSLTNASGAMGGDLDPTKGMYWAWNSGYINAKLEGYAAKCPARNHWFEFHIGGYMPPFQTVQLVELQGFAKREIKMDMELSTFFEEIDLGVTHGVMSPSATASRLAVLLAKTFRLHGQ